MHVQEGIEISRSSGLQKEMHPAKKRCKLPCTDLVIHPRFMHFMHMLWLVGRVDHIIRSIVRCWQHHNQQTSGRGMLAEASAAAGVASIEDCKRFLEDKSGHISAMGTLFSYAVQHVKCSLERLYVEDC